MVIRPRVWRSAPLILMLAVGCGKQGGGGDGSTGPTEERGELPVRDPAKEAEAAARREARINQFQPAEAKLVEAIKGRLSKYATPSGKERAVSLSLTSGGVFPQTAVLSPDGTRVAVYEYDFKAKTGRHRVVDLASGKNLCSFSSLPGGGGGFKETFTPDGTGFAAGGTDKQLAIWDANSGQLRHRFPFDKMVWSVALTPDGAGLIASIAGRLVLLDPESGQTRRTYADEAVHTSNACVAPSGALIATSAGTHNDQLVLWEAATGRKADEWKAGGSVSGLVFSPDGWSLLVRETNRLVLRDIAARTERAVTSGGIFGTAALSPDGRLLAYTTGKALVIVDLGSGKERTIDSVLGDVVGFFPGGTLLATFDNSTLHLWNVAAIQPPSAK